MVFLHEIVTFALATLAGLGVGSGGVYLLWLTEIMGIDKNDAIFLNLCFFIAALLVASIIHARKKRVDYRFLLQIILFGIPGAFLGRWLNALLSPLFLRAFLGFFLIFSGVFSLLVTKKKKNTGKTPLSLDKTAKKDYNN